MSKQLAKMFSTARKSRTDANINIYLVPCVQFENAATDNMNIGLCSSKQTVPRRTVGQWYLQQPHTVPYTPWTIKKRGTIFDYNYDISWPIFTLFAANETGINTLQWNYTFSKFTLAVSIHYLVKPSVSMKHQIQHETSNFGVSHHNVLLFNNSNESASFLQCLCTKCLCTHTRSEPTLPLTDQ